MKITITPSGGSAYELAGISGDSFRTNPNSLRIATAQVVQAAQGLRWAKIKPFARLNTAVKISFSVSRIFGSVDSAVGFMATHANNVPTSGVLTITDDAATGSYSASAAFDTIETKMTGATIQIDYALTSQPLA